jgi:hypothetical protein
MLNALIIVGALISVLNLGDLLLRPQQKEAFHRFIENLTVILDYTRPMIWFARLGERKFAVVWTIISALLVFLTYPGIRMIRGTPALLVDLWSNTLGTQISTVVFGLAPGNIDLAMRSLYAFFAINLLTIPVTFWFIGSRVTIFLASGNRIIIFIVRILVMYVATVVLACALYIGAANNPRSLWYAAIVGVPGLLILPVPIVVVTIGMLMMCLTLLLFVLGLFLKVSRMICWKVVEYSKGAWAAVIAFLTAALCIYKALLS